MVDLNNIVDYISFLSKSITEKIVDFLVSNGINVSERWVGLLILFASLLLGWIGLKITLPLIKWVLIVLAIVLILGLIMPGW